MQARRVLMVVAVLGLLGAAGCSKRIADGSTAGAGISKASGSAVPAPPAADALTPRTAAARAPLAAAPGERAAPAGQRRNDAASAAARRLVRTVDLDETVPRTTEAVETLERLAPRLGGYVASVDGQREDELMRWTLTLRVPPDRLDEALAAAKAMAVRVNREQQKVEDVTDQYVDLDARLRTLAATEAELRALLAESRQRQRKVDDVMSIYRELTEIRSQSERLQGQLLALEKGVAFSTLNVTLAPVASARPVVAEGWHPADTLRGSLRTLVGMLKWLGDAAIFAAIVLLPAALVVVLAAWAVRRVWRLLRRWSGPTA
jgi:hypothetical protein